jgi:hypothetical protein
MLNANIPSFKALVRKSYFTKNQEDHNEFLQRLCFWSSICCWSYTNIPRYDR